MARKARDYAAEERRRNELARERGFENRYKERVTKANPIITEAEKWQAFKLTYPLKKDRTVTRAQVFISGFGPGLGEPHEDDAGHFATEQQKEDRARYIRDAQYAADRYMNSIFSPGELFWRAW